MMYCYCWPQTIGTIAVHVRGTTITRADGRQRPPKPRRRHRGATRLAGASMHRPVILGRWCRRKRGGRKTPMESTWHRTRRTTTKDRKKIQPRPGGIPTIASIRGHGRWRLRSSEVEAVERPRKPGWPSSDGMAAAPPWFSFCLMLHCCCCFLPLTCSRPM